VRGRICAAVLVAVVACSTTALTSPSAQAVDDGPRARHHHTDGYRHYAVMGDSITAGAGTSDWTFDPTGTYVRVAHLYSYGEQAGLRTYAVGSACIAGDWCGFGADGSDRVALRWFATVMLGLKHRPSTVVTHIGINDLSNGYTAEQVIAGLLALRLEGRSLGIRVVFGTVGPSTELHPAWNLTQPERLRLNDWIRASQRTYVDYARTLEGLDGWLRPEFESEFHDVHVNDAGAAAMAATVGQWVRHDVQVQAEAHAG
jgi:GDSL-like lipase/acylhydrolase family protein